MCAPPPHSTLAALLDPALRFIFNSSYSSRVGLPLPARYHLSRFLKVRQRYASVKMKTSSFALAAALVGAAAESQYTTFTISSGVTQTFTLPSWPTVSIASSAAGGGGE